MFEALPVPPIDPILALGSVVRADARPDKIDLGIGVYRDESGRTPIMGAVAEAERRRVADLYRRGRADQYRGASIGANDGFRPGDSESQSELSLNDEASIAVCSR